MNRIQKVSSYLLVFLNMGIILLPLGLFLIWCFIDTLSLHHSQDLLYGMQYEWIPKQDLSSTVKFTFLAKTLGLSGDLIEYTPLFISFFILKNIFNNYKNNLIFTSANAAQYKKLGYLFFWNALLAQPLGNMLLVLMRTINSPSGETISLSIGDNTFGGIFCGLCVLVISWVMAEGCRLQEEQKLIV